MRKNCISGRKNPEKQKQDIFLSREFPATDKSGVFEPAFFKSEREDKNAIWLKEDEEKKAKMKRIKKIGLIAGLSILGLTLLIFGVMILRKKAFTEDKVFVVVTGPTNVKSGDTATIEIEYKNDNWVDLKNAVLNITYAENFKPDKNLAMQPNGPNAATVNIGTVKSGSDIKFELKGKFFGTKDLLTYVNAKLSYNSTTFSSTFETENKLAVMITSSPLAIEITGPLSVYSGGDVTYTVNVKNTGEESFRGLILKAQYPEGFSFSSSEPLAVSGSNTWYVGDLTGGQTSVIKIMGKITGVINEIKKLKVSLGTGSENDFVAYNENENNTKIVGSPLDIKQLVNGKNGDQNVNAGDILNFVVSFKNTGKVPLRDVILTEQIKSTILDYKSYKTDTAKGGLDSSKGTITWTGSQLDALRVLAPGASGEVTFSIGIMDKIKVQGVSDKNFAFQATASMDSPDIPTPESSNKQIASNALGIKLNSKLMMNLTGYYNDPDISNSGPLPLQVGQETTFTMHLAVGNVSNDITDAKVVMALSPGVKWKNNFLPKNESLSYNDRTNELIWNIGTMPAGVGILTDPKTLIFQIGFVPSGSQSNNFVSLVRSTVFTVSDTFTKQGLSIKLDEKTSDLTEDISIGEGGKVGN